LKALAQLHVLLLRSVQVLAHRVELNHEVLLVMCTLLLHHLELLGDLALILQLGDLRERPVPFLRHQLHLIDDSLKLMLELVPLLHELRDRTLVLMRIRKQVDQQFNRGREVFQVLRRLIILKKQVPQRQELLLLVLPKLGFRLLVPDPRQVKRLAQANLLLLQNLQLLLLLFECGLQVQVLLLQLLGGLEKLSE